MAAAWAGELEDWTKEAPLVLEVTISHVRYTYDAQHNMPATIWGLEVAEAIKGSVGTGWVEMRGADQGYTPQGRYRPPMDLVLWPGDRLVVFGKIGDEGTLELLHEELTALVAIAGRDGALYAHDGTRHPVATCAPGRRLAQAPRLPGTLLGGGWEEAERKILETTAWDQACGWTALLEVLRVAAREPGQRPAAAAAGVPPLPREQQLPDKRTHPIP